MASTENPTSWVVMFGKMPQIEYDRNPQGLPINPRIVGRVRFFDEKLPPINIYAFVPDGRAEEFQGLLSGKQVVVDHFPRDPDREKQGENADPFLMVDTRPFSEVILRKNVIIESFDPPTISFNPLTKAEELREMVAAFVQSVDQSGKNMPQPATGENKDEGELTVKKWAESIQESPYSMLGFMHVDPKRTYTFPDDKMIRLRWRELLDKLSKASSRISSDDLEFTKKTYERLYSHLRYIDLRLRSKVDTEREEGQDLFSAYKEDSSKGFIKTELAMQKALESIKNSGK